MKAAPFLERACVLTRTPSQRRARWLSSAIFWVLGTCPRTGSLLLTHQLEDPLGPCPSLALPSPLQGALFPQWEVPVRQAQLLWTQGSAQRLVDECVCSSLRHGVWIKGHGSGRHQAGLKARVCFGAASFGLDPGAAPVSHAALVRACGLSVVRWGQESLGCRVPTGRDLMCTRGPGLRAVGVLVRALSLPRCWSPSTGMSATGSWQPKVQNCPLHGLEAS